MKRRNKKFYLVDFAILPESIKKTITVKEMLKEGATATIHEAVSKVGISRSAYYKYKDHVAPASEVPNTKLCALEILLSEDISVLNKVLKRIIKENTIVSVNRNMPVGKYCVVVIVFRTALNETLLGAFINSLSHLKGVKSVQLINQEF